MTRIVLEVDDTVGRIYRGFSNEGKEKINAEIGLILKKAANDAKFTEYSKLLDDTSAEAARNGLTPEILEDLLSSDD